MKRIYFKSLVVMILLIFTMACDDKLELDPQQNVDTQEQLTTSEGVINFLIGVYSHIAGQTTTVYEGELYGADFNLISELLGSDGEVIWTGTFSTYRDIYNMEAVNDNVVVTNNWIRAYEAINMCNLVLANIEVVDEELQDQIKGEALALRSALFFELVRLYALPYEAGGSNTQLGIPIVTEPNTELSDIGEEDYPSRDPVEEVYNRIVADLNTAVELLPADNGVRVGKFAALAFLARVYLQQGNYVGARDAANRVIEEGPIEAGYELLSDYTRNFNNSANTSEDIFAIQQNSLFNAGTSNAGLTTFYANSEQSGRDGDIDITPEHLMLYEDGEIDPETGLYVGDDVRGEFFYLGVDDGLPKTSKWLVEYAIIPVIRLAEMYLVRAEANFRLGTAVGAAPVEDLNTIRNRAGLDDFEGTLTLQEILDERRRELAFEGLRLHDLKRNQKTINGEPYNSEALVLPIPRRELDNNSNLE